MYELACTTDTRRTYRSSITGTEIFTNMIYQDGAGNKWWSFEDLLQIPFIRKKASEKVSQLYGVSISKEDLTGFITRTKAIAKGTDPERYEKVYSELLQLEQIINETSDPVKQSLSLCSIYIMADGERVDTFSFSDAGKKMELWALDLDAQAFFLNWLTDGMNDFTRHYNSIMQIASPVKAASSVSPREPITN